MTSPARSSRTTGKRPCTLSHNTRHTKSPCTGEHLESPHAVDAIIIVLDSMNPGCLCTNSSSCMTWRPGGPTFVSSMNVLLGACRSRGVGGPLKLAVPIVVCVSNATNARAACDNPLGSWSMMHADVVALAATPTAEPSRRPGAPHGRRCWALVTADGHARTPGPSAGPEPRRQGRTIIEHLSKITSGTVICPAKV